MLLTASAACSLFAADAPILTTVATRDPKVVKRWAVKGEPCGVAIGRDGIVYVGLAAPQAVLAIDSKTGTIAKEVVLDSAEIASTKELVTLRTNADRTRLYIANGSDESATILSLPDLGIIREITTEGEAIRDALPDPKGRYLYLLGRRVHVYDAKGETELRTIDLDDPMAMATTSDGATLAVLGSEDFGNTRATVVALFSTNGFAEIARDPLQTDKPVEAAMFAANDRALIAIAREYLYEKPIVSRAAKTMSNTNGAMRMTIDFGDLVNSDRICLPEGSGPQIATLGATSDQILFAERRCASSTAFAGASRRITPASLYGVNAYAVAYDASANTLVVTDRAGFVTIYKVPRAAVSK